MVAPLPLENTARTGVRHLPQALTHLGNPKENKCSAAHGMNAAERTELWWQWGEASAKAGLEAELVVKKRLFPRSDGTLPPPPCTACSSLCLFFQPPTWLCHLLPCGAGGGEPLRGISCSPTTKGFLDNTVWSLKEFVLLHLFTLDQET